VPSRSLNVVISGDARQLNGALTSAGKHMEGLEKRGHHMSGVLVKGFALAGAAAGTALVVGLKKSASAAMEAEKSHARLEAQLKASGISYRAHAREIDNVIQKTSKLAGLDDEDLQDAFTNIVRSTGSVSKGLRGIGLAADIARAKHIDVAKAGQLVGKVASGNVTALARYGIQIDKNATSSQALAELQKRFAGQAEAYGKTAAGAQDRFRVAVENLEEKLGAVLLPVLAKVARGVAKFLEGIESGRGVGGRFAKAIGDAFNTIKSVVGSSVTAVRGFLARNRDDIQSVERAVRNVARAVKAVIENVLIPAFRILLPAVRDVVEGMLRSIRGLVRIVSGVLTGDWSKAWDGIKDVVKGSLKAIVALLKGAGELLVKAAGAAGEGIAKGILSGLGSLGHLLLDAVKKAVGWVAGKVGSVGSSIGKALNPFGDGLGASMMPSIPGLGGGGSLMGADQDLQPFASLAAGMGLHTTSGLRPGSITSSGNVSWHSSGDAIDEAGPLPAMRRYAQTLHDRLRRQPARADQSVGELGIKDGHPFRYSGRDPGASFRRERSRPRRVYRAVR
jgi:hypothetical protein